MVNSQLKQRENKILSSDISIYFAALKTICILSRSASVICYYIVSEFVI